MPFIIGKTDDAARQLTVDLDEKKIIDSNGVVQTLSSVMDVARQLSTEEDNEETVSLVITGDYLLNELIPDIDEYIAENEIPPVTRNFSPNALDDFLDTDASIYSFSSKEIDDDFLSAPKKAKLETKHKLSEPIWDEDDEDEEETEEEPEGIFGFLRDDDYNETLKVLLGRKNENFHDMLFRLIEEKGLTAPQVYKKANIDKKLFSKIKNDSEYRPRKSTAMSLAIALELNLDQAKDLLSKAGYSLDPSIKQDLVVMYFIEKRKYDILLIESAMYEYGLPLLSKY